MIQIDRKKIYLSHGFKFKNFVILSEQEKRRVWEWRNDESIRSRMYNTNIISWENHLKFIKVLNNSTDRYYWLIFKGHTSIGVLDITSYDSTLCRAEIGYYANPKIHGIGFEMLRECFYFCLNVIGITNLYLTVRKDNRRASLLNQFLGMTYTSTMVKEIDNKSVQFHVCDCFTLTDFEGKYNLSKADYESFISKNI